MKFKQKIYILPWYLSWYARGMTIGTRIYIRKDIYNDLKSSSPNHQSVGILVHEQTHVKRIKKAGSIKFGIKYWTNREYRYQEEKAAIKEQMKYLKSVGEKHDYKRQAKNLAGKYYLWCVSKPRAIKELEEMWKEICSF